MMGYSKEVKDSLGKKIDTVQQIILNRPYLVFRPSSTVEQIVRDMQRHNQGVACITGSDGRLVGIMTERDILRKIFGVHGESENDYDERHHHLSVYPETLTAWDVMVTNPVCLTEDMPVEKALEEIKRHGFRFMPVVKRGSCDQLTGIVSERELFWHAQDKLRRKLDSQTSMLSYLMHHEDYGGAGGSLADAQLLN